MQLPFQASHARTLHHNANRRYKLSHQLNSCTRNTSQLPHWTISPKASQLATLSTRTQRSLESYTYTRVSLVYENTYDSRKTDSHLPMLFLRFNTYVPKVSASISINHLGSFPKGNKCDNRKKKSCPICLTIETCFDSYYKWLTIQSGLSTFSLGT